jgi:methylase of polypeptide subunit release factors
MELAQEHVRHAPHVGEGELPSTLQLTFDRTLFLRLAEARRGEGFLTLGQVYEQLLGKSVFIGADGTPRIEEKPEVRKAGGVYYSPAFVVDYIVRATLGPLLEEATAEQVERLRIIDPACGAGVFLLAAYQYLLDWHQAKSGGQRLPLETRKRLLLRHIFGVDLDPRAVEVAKLSLVLKLLEGEQELASHVERLLPELAGHIVRGNALIGPDLSSALSSRQAASVVPFDWEQTFPEAFAEGGFDAVIGNPPYLRVDDTWGRGDVRLAYLKRTYREVYNDKTDLLFYFLKRAVDLSRSEVAFIVSRAFLEAYKADRLRGWLGENVRIREVLDFQNAAVFPGVGITTSIVRLTRRQTGPALFRRFQPRELPPGMSAERLLDASLFETVEVPQHAFRSAPWAFAKARTQELLERIDGRGTPVGDILHIGQGMQTGANTVFGRRTAEELEAWGVPGGQGFIRARNSDIGRYRIEDSGERILYLEDVEDWSHLPEGVQAHLLRHEEDLKARAAWQRGNCEWWRFTWPLHKQHAHTRKLLCPYLATENRFALDAHPRFLGLTDTTVLYDAGQPEDLRYLLGVLNSRLLTFRFRYLGKLKSGNLREYFENTVSKLPIPRLAAEDPRHVRLVTLVDEALSLAERQAPRLEAVERLIDQEVYALFGITPEEQSHIEQVLGMQG